MLYFYIIEGFKFNFGIPFIGTLDHEYSVSLPHTFMALTALISFIVGWVLFSTAFVSLHAVNLFFYRKLLGVVRFVVLTLFLIILSYSFDSLIFFLTKILVPLIINALVFLVFIGSFFA